MEEELGQEEKVCIDDSPGHLVVQLITPSVLLSGDVAQDNVLQSLSPSAH